MKTIFLFFVLFIFPTFILYSQELETLGAGIIDFLLTNPETANRTNATEAAALNVIGNLLSISAQRKHDLNVAEAGRDQMTINTTTGQQAQLVTDENGNVYILYNGIIRKISEKLLNEAKQTAGIIGSKENEISMYDLGELKTKYETGRKYTNIIKSVFSYKWEKDFNGDGSYSFDEFKQIKKQFSNNEQFSICVTFEYLGEVNTEIEVSIYNDYNGDLVYKTSRNITGEARLWGLEFFKISQGKLSPGMYLISVNILNGSTRKSMSSYNETLCIIRGDKGTFELSDAEKTAINKITNTTPRNIFFFTSYKDRNQDGKYDYDEFIGLNKPNYSLSQDTVYVGVNIPEAKGKVMIQSLTDVGLLLTTTSFKFQEVFLAGICPSCDPYKTKDFLEMIKISGPGRYSIRVNFIEIEKSHSTVIDMVK